MDAFGGAFRSTVHDYLGLHGENKQLKKQLNGDNAVIKQSLNVCQISGQGGSPTYAVGSRPGFITTDPLVWDDIEENIALEPFFQVGDDENGTQAVQQQCLIENVPHAECHVGNRVYRFSEADRTICGYINASSGFLRYYYIFKSSLNVELTVVVEFSVNSEITLGWNRDRLNTDDLANPSNFQNDQIASPVKFPAVSFLVDYPSSDEEGE